MLTQMLHKSQFKQKKKHLLTKQTKIINSSKQCRTFEYITIEINNLNTQIFVHFTQQHEVFVVQITFLRRFVNSNTTKTKNF